MAGFGQDLGQDALGGPCSADSLTIPRSDVGTMPCHAGHVPERSSVSRVEAQNS